MGKGRRSGQRRAYLKRFSASMVNSGSIVDRSRFKTDDLYKYHDRASSAGMEIPTTITINPLLNKRVAIREQLEMKKLVQTTFFQKIQTYNHVVLVKGKVQRLKMFFYGNEAFFVEENLAAGRMRRSVVYKGREKAMRYYNIGKLTWVESIEIPPRGETNGRATRLTSE